MLYSDIIKKKKKKNRTGIKRNKNVCKYKVLPETFDDNGCRTCDRFVYVNTLRA